MGSSEQGRVPSALARQVSQVALNISLGPRLQGTHGMLHTWRPGSLLSRMDILGKNLLNSSLPTKNPLLQSAPFLFLDPFVSYFGVKGIELHKTGF